MKRLFTILLAVLSLLSLTACGGSPTEETSQEPLVDIQPQEPEAPPEPTPEELAAQEVEDLLASLTLEEKVGQLFFVRVPDTDAVSDVSTYHLGGYILFGRDTADKTADALIQTIQSYQDAAAVDTGIPLLIGVDEEGGTVVRVSSNPHLRASKFPSPQKAYASGGMEAVLADTREKDRLLSALGFNVNLSPVADVSTNPADFMYDRTFGQDAAQRTMWPRWSRRWRKTVWAASSSTSPAMGTMWIPTPVSPWTSGRWSPSRPPTSSPSRRVWRAAAERPLCWSPTIS